MKNRPILELSITKRKIKVPQHHRTQNLANTRAGYLERRVHYPPLLNSRENACQWSGPAGEVLMCLSQQREKGSRGAIIIEMLETVPPRTRSPSSSGSRARGYYRAT